MTTTLPDDNEAAAIQDAVAKLFDGDLSKEEFAALEHRLRTDPAAREIYFQCVSLENSLGAAYAPPLSRRLGSGSADRRQVKWALGIAAAAALVILSVMSLIKMRSVPHETGLQICGNSQWMLDGEQNRQSSTLPEGVEFLLQQGVAELQLPHGVVAVVEAPAAMVQVDEQTLRMHYGRALFQVPAEGVGFTVETPRQRIVDLGTEFGIDFAKGEDAVELHVLEGSVRVDAIGADGGGEEISAKRAVLLDGTRIERALAADERGAFRRELPPAVETLLVENFETGVAEEAQGQNKLPAGWQKSAGGLSGTLNPGGNGLWYTDERLADSSPSRGVIGAMSGSAMGYTQPGSKVRREFGEIAADSRYTVSVAIGVRMEHPRGTDAQFSGYTISLLSGDTVLAQLSSDAPPGRHNSVTTVSFSWDSSQLPDGVNAGDPIAIEIGSNDAAPGRHSYLDFDNVRVSALANPGGS